MKKISALDFLNKEKFNTDVYLENGVIVFSEGSEVTQELLLRAYFKKLYVKDEYEKKYLEIDALEEKTNERNKADVPVVNNEKEISKKDEIENNEIVEKVEIVENLKFDEELAKQVSQLSEKVSKKLGYSPNETEEIRLAAYYKDIAIKDFNTQDVTKCDFYDLVGIASYNVMREKMNFPEKVAEVAKLYFKDYNVRTFKLNKEEKPPYAHLIAITDFYVKLAKNEGKEKALDKILKIGSNKFNIYILHKFVNIMKEDL